MLKVVATSIKISAVVAAVCVSQTSAFAAPPQRGMDHFSTNSHTRKPVPQTKTETPPDNLSNPNLGKGAGAMFSDQSPALRFFEGMDKEIIVLSPTRTESVKLSQHFNQEAERVQEWIRIAGKISNQYRLLAKNLKTMTVPQGASDLKEYRDLTADWYSDAAEVYGDLIKPRRAARTMDELEDGLKQIENRAKGLQSQRKMLVAMDRELRTTYRVHANQHHDALRKYVMGADAKKLGQ